jgi:hypothetical protein
MFIFFNKFRTRILFIVCLRKFGLPPGEIACHIGSSLEKLPKSSVGASVGGLSVICMSAETKLFWNQYVSKPSG